MLSSTAHEFDYHMKLQSGYILIKKIFVAFLLTISLHSNLVIFQRNNDKMILHILVLYIPIWLYSNEFSDTSSEAAKDFTFQSGYIPTR